MDVVIVWINAFQHKEIIPNEVMTFRNGINKKKFEEIRNEVENIFYGKMMNFSEFIDYNENSGSDLFLIVYYYLNKIEEFLYSCMDLKKYIRSEWNETVISRSDQANLAGSKFISISPKNYFRFDSSSIEDLVSNQIHNPLEGTTNPRITVKSKLFKHITPNIEYTSSKNGLELDFQINTGKSNGKLQIPKFYTVINNQLAHENLSPLKSSQKIEKSHHIRQKSDVVTSIVKISPGPHQVIKLHSTPIRNFKFDLKQFKEKLNPSSKSIISPVSPMIPSEKMVVNVPNNIRHSGYMSKLNYNKTELRRFFFQLKRTKLIYYTKSEKLAKPKGIISLFRCFFKGDGRIKFQSQWYWAISIYHNITKDSLYLADELDYENWLSVFKDNFTSVSQPLIGQYQILDFIGQGKFSIVHKAINIYTKVIVAVKIIRKTILSKVDFASIRREVSILKVCDHENIIKFKQYDETFEYMYIFQEFFENSIHLNSYLEKNNFNLEEPLVKKIIHTVVSVVEYLHSNGIIHRDIKAENILVQEEKNVLGEKDLKIKLIDFGLSRFLGKNEQVIGEAFGTLVLY